MYLPIHYVQDRPDVALEGLLPQLTKAEQAYAHSLYHIRAREFILGRALVRHVARQFVGRDMARAPFIYSPTGKPYWPQSPWQVSIAHSHGMVACALYARGRIGLDVEWMGRPLKRGWITRFFSPTECKRLAELPNHAAARDYFFTLWTLKEALWKAHDFPPGTDMEKLTFTLSPLELTGMDTAGWQFAEGKLSPEHQLALCIEMDEPLINWEARVYSIGDLEG